MFNWTCPQCKRIVRFPSIEAAALAARGRNGVAGCQACRVAMMLDDKSVSLTTLTAVFDFFDRKGWPKGWIEG